MNSIVAPFKELFKLNPRKIYIDNFGFRIHYRWTMIFLLFFSILVTSKQYIGGDAINCLSRKEILPIANDYCWIHGGFTKGRYTDGKWTYESVPEDPNSAGSPGVEATKVDQKLIFHTYYQWVWLVLIFQALSFCFPHWIWKKIENGRVKMLVSTLNIPAGLCSDEEKAQSFRSIIDYLRANQGYHNNYVAGHITCELINFINIILQLFALDLFLNHQFSNYGLKVFSISQTRPYIRDDPLTRVFPTMIACKLTTGGLGFGNNNHDLLCVLPLNILNEKIYIFLWFWFIFVAIITSMALVYRFLTFIPRIRLYLIGRKSRQIDTDLLGYYINDLKYGDWFLIYKLGQNMDQVTYGSLLKELYRNTKYSNMNNEKSSAPLLYSAEP